MAIENQDAILTALLANYFDVGKRLNRILIFLVLVSLLVVLYHLDYVESGNGFTIIDVKINIPPSVYYSSSSCLIFLLMTNIFLLGESENHVINEVKKITGDIDRDLVNAIDYQGMPHAITTYLSYEASVTNLYQSLMTWSLITIVFAFPLVAQIICLYEVYTVNYELFTLHIFLQLFFISTNIIGIVFFAKKSILRGKLKSVS